MAAQRHITVDNVTFTINQEPVAHINNAVQWHYSRVQTTWVWPDDHTQGWPANPVPAVNDIQVRCGAFSPTATITATATNDAGHAELTRWRAGYLQNVVAQNRTAAYVNAINHTQATITRGSQVPYPIRDGEPAEFPFNNTGKGLTHGVAETIDNGDDEPFFSVPFNLDHATANGVSYQLQNVAGGDSFVTWLALARSRLGGGIGANRISSNQPCIVLLSKVTWQTNYNVAIPPGYHPNPTAPLLQALPLPPLIISNGFQPVAPLQAVKNRQALGNGQNWPDLRKDYSCNEFSFYSLTVAGNLVQRWIDGNENGEHDAFVAMNAPDPNLQFI